MARPSFRILVKDKVTKQSTEIAACWESEHVPGAYNITFKEDFDPKKHLNKENYWVNMYALQSKREDDL